MIFCTYWFLVTVAIFLPIYWIIQVPKLRLAILILFCCLFHLHFAGPAGVAPIIVLGLITYLIGLSRNQHACLFGIALCAVALCFYKYTHFFFISLFAQLDQFHFGQEVDKYFSYWLPAAPPLAISFFVFEFVHYLVEIRKGSEPIKNPFNFIQFTIYFPSLVAGPIKRYKQFIPALYAGIKNVTHSDIAQGLLRVATGFFKKVVIADNLNLYINFNSPRFVDLSMQERWLFLFAIALHIYMDFSGYSDIAIGLSRMMGISLPPNFNWPYVARNIQEFWQRWHISLSTWIRDYIYIPLGGNRSGGVRKLFNGFIAFALCGLWHGAAWNFIAWGLYHGAGFAVCSNYRRTLGPIGRSIGTLFDKLPMVSWAVTIIFVSLGWLLFFYPVDQAWKMTRLLFLKSV
jgi:alginate O-acetyltransferase complex protein AlgI